MSLKLAQGLSFFRGGGWFEEKKADSAPKPEIYPSFRIKTDRESYRPGDSVIVTLEIHNPRSLSEGAQGEQLGNGIRSVLVDGLSFEVKGVEKLDPQWFATRKPVPGSKQQRGEHIFLESTAQTIISKVIVSSGCTKTYIVRVELPKLLPPSYRGASIRYTYYIRSALSARWLLLENAHCDRACLDDLIQLEARVPLQVWVAQNSSNLLTEGRMIPTTFQLDIFWKEKDGDSEWSRPNEYLDSFDEGYDSSREEASSISSFNHTKGEIDIGHRRSLSLQSVASRLSTNGFQYSHPNVSLAQLSVSEVIDDGGSDTVSPQKMLTHSSSSISESKLKNNPNSPFSMDDKGSPFASGSREVAISEGFSRGRSYNIRIDDKVLLRFSPKNSDTTYYFGDMVGGTLTFFRGGTTRCLEVSVTLETSEIINQRSVHPSRRRIPTISKVLSDHHEVVADLLQSSFFFTIPVDGPMSFSTPNISVQWLLRFEFFTTPADVDLDRYEHPLLIKDREKRNWVLPITVCAPPPRTQNARTEKSLSLGNLFHT